MKDLCRYTTWINKIILIIFLPGFLGFFSVTTAIADSEDINLANLILFSDGTGLYALNPYNSETAKVGIDFAVPPHIMIDSPYQITNSHEWPADIVISTGYAFFDGLISPSKKELVYVEAICEKEECRPIYNVWLVNLITHKRQKLFDNKSSSLKDIEGKNQVLPNPKGWYEPNRIMALPALT